MDLSETEHLIARLEKDLGTESVYRPTLESMIAELMEITFRSEDPTEKTRLAMLEMRARRILDRWKSRDVN